MSFSIIIPSRFSSTRLPGKPLLDIAGKPMIQWVYERSIQSDAENVIIATDDQRIVEVCRQFTSNVMLTSVDHLSGTDRLQEAVNRQAFAEDHIVVNVQGDEPLIPPEVINQVANNLAINHSAGISTLCEKIENVEDLSNPNAVKVVCDINEKALYFSRAAVPWSREWPSPKDHSAAALKSRESILLNSGFHWYRHIGIYAYRVSILNQFVQWPATNNERCESLEQLRALDNGVTIHCQQAIANIPAGVDTQDDLVNVRALLQ